METPINDKTVSARSHRELGYMAENTPIPMEITVLNTKEDMAKSSVFPNRSAINAATGACAG